MSTAVDQPTPADATANSVEFVSATNYSGGSELHPASLNVDVKAYRDWVRALESAGFDYTLNGYSAASADSFIVAAATGQLTERLKPIVALRPNTVFPLVAAQSLATLDQLTGGRAVVHLISGGLDAEQARQGDYLPKDERYARTSEYIDLLRRAWTEKAPFSFDGKFYKFDDFGPGFATYSGESIPISIGGQSDAAFQVGGAKADWFTFWGEPLAEVRREIERVHAIADQAGRPRQKIWVTFRPIIAKTDALAWEKAYEVLGSLAVRGKAGTTAPARFLRNLGDPNPQNKGSQRALGFAEASEQYDRALWTPTASATNGAGASTALVGSYETVAAAILDYVDAGANVVSIRGYEGIADIEQYGEFILPLVRQELAQRAAGQRGRLQSEHLGYGDPDFLAAHDAAAAKAGVAA